MPEPDSRTLDHVGSLKNDELLLEFAIEEFRSFQQSKRFVRTVAELIPILANKDVLVCEFRVNIPHLNGKEKLHGGQSLTIIDVVTSRAISLTQRNRKKVSLELSASYMLPISFDEEILVIARVKSIGPTTAYAECEFRRKSDGALCVLGKHTMCLLS